MYTVDKTYGTQEQLDCHLESEFSTSGGRSGSSGPHKLCSINGIKKLTFPSQDFITPEWAGPPPVCPTLALLLSRRLQILPFLFYLSHVTPALQTDSINSRQI